jgi:hypothetical protein
MIDINNTNSFKGIQAVRIDFFNTKSCQYSMFYTNSQISYLFCYIWTLLSFIV